MRISKEKPGIPRMKGFSRFVDTRLMNALSKRVLHFASELYIPKRHGCNGRSVFMDSPASARKWNEKNKLFKKRRGEKALHYILAIRGQRAQTIFIQRVDNSRKDTWLVSIFLFPLLTRYLAARCRGWVRSIGTARIGADFRFREKLEARIREANTKAGWRAWKSGTHAFCSVKLEVRPVLIWKQIALEPRSFSGTMEMLS